MFADVTQTSRPRDGAGGPPPACATTAAVRGGGASRAGVCGHASSSAAHAVAASVASRGAPALDLGGACARGRVGARRLLLERHSTPSQGARLRMQKLYVHVCPRVRWVGPGLRLSLAECETLAGVVRTCSALRRLSVRTNGQLRMPEWKHILSGAARAFVRRCRPWT